MPRRRNLHDLACATSVILCAATGVLWIGSYAVRPEVCHDGWNRRSAVLRGGAIQFLAFSRFTQKTVGWAKPGIPIVSPDRQFRYAATPAWHFAWHSDLSLPPAGDAAVVRRLANFVSGGLPQPGLIDGGGFEVSLWPLVACLAILPALWLFRRGRFVAARRMARGLCPSCGYDMRATPDRCPECGATPTVR